MRKNRESSKRGKKNNKTGQMTRRRTMERWRKRRARGTKDEGGGGRTQFFRGGRKLEDV